MLTFRPASSDDLDELSKINNVPPERVDFQKEIQKKRIEKGQAPNKEYLVALTDNKLVGNFLIEYETRFGYPRFSCLEVKEDLRGQGIGTQIISEIERRAKEKDFDMLGCSVNPDHNPRALKLYEKLGYKNTGAEKYAEYIDPWDGAKDFVIDLIKML